jgi:hypothetical protein
MVAGNAAGFRFGHARARALVGLFVAALVAAAAATPFVVGQSEAAAVTPRLRGPVLARDFPDPEIVFDSASGRYFTFSTNAGHFGFWNVPVASSTDLTTWTILGDALQDRDLPSWSAKGNTWAPGVARIGATWLLYFTARHRASGRQCIGVATSSQPQGPYVPQGLGPLVCQTDRGGSIDAAPFQDPRTGAWWLHWKSDENAPGVVNPIPRLWARQLTANGLAFAGSATVVLAYDQAGEAPLVEAPDMVFASGSYWLFYSAGRWDSAGYRAHWARCSGPAGPCQKLVSPSDPWLGAASGIAGPGGASLVPVLGGSWAVAFHGWIRAIGYAQGGERALFIEPVTFDGSGAGFPRLRPDLSRAPAPIGSLDSIGLDRQTISVAGWALDPKVTAAIAVRVYINGVHRATFTANGLRPDVGAAYPHWGPNRGFSGQVASVSGRNDTCVYAMDSTGVQNRLLGCRTLNDLTAAAPPPPAGGPPSRFMALTPSRLLDTRTGIGAAYAGPVPAGGTLTLQVAGRGGVATANATVAVLNVAVTAPAGPGHITVWPGGAVPVAANLNFERAGQVIANQVLAPLDATGAVRLRTTTTTHLVVDVNGFFSTDGVVAGAGSDALASVGRFTAVSNSRLLDTRLPGAGPLAGGSSTKVPVTTRAPIPPDATAAVVTIVAIRPPGPGYLTVWSGTGPRPLASTLNYGPNQVIANQAFVPLAPDGTFTVYTTSYTHLVVDITGYFTGVSAPESSAGLFEAAGPYRALDTRTRGLRATAGAGFELDLQGSGWLAVALNMAVTNTAGAGHITAWDSQGPRPAVATMNYDTAGQVRAAAATVGSGGDTRIAISSAADAHLILDVAGFYTG